MKNIKDIFDANINNLAIVIDVSASMPKSIFHDTLNEIKQHSKDLNKITIVTADYRVVDIFHSFEEMENHRNFKGGAGTIFSPAIEMFKENPPDLLIYITDGYGEFPDNAPDFSVVWCLTKGHYKNIPFGEIIRI